MKQHLQNAILGMIIISCGNLYAQPAWNQKASFPTGATSEDAYFSIGNFGYVGAATADLWQYDPALNVWTQMAAFPGGIRFSSVGFSIGTKGYFGTGGTFNDFYEYDQPTNTWTQKLNFGGSGREGAVGLAINGKGYIGTGGNYLNDWWEYDPTNDTWTQKADLNGPGRYHAGEFTIGNFGYVCCGFNGSFLNDLLQYDPALNTWTSKANLPAIARDRPVGFAISTKGYIATGWSGGNALDDFNEYDPVNNSWSVLLTVPGGGRYNASGFSIGNKAYVGFGIGGAVGDDFWEYTGACVAQISTVATTCFGGCDGSAIVLLPDSNSVVSYQWSNGSTEASQTGLCGGSFTVTITDTVGCVSVNPIVIPQPKEMIGFYTPTLPLCNGDSNGGLCISADFGHPPYSYTWAIGLTDSCITGITAGLYYVTITDDLGCTKIDSAILSQPTQLGVLINHADASCSSCNDGSASIAVSGGTSPFTYQWSNGSTSSFLPGLLPGVYSCCVTDNNGCSFCDSVSISVVAGFEEFYQEDFKITPNPFVDQIIILSKKINQNDVSVSVFDIAGRRVDSEIHFADQKVILNTGNLNPGCYFIWLEFIEKRLAFKIIKAVH